MPDHHSLNQALQAIKSGDKRSGWNILAKIVRENPQDEQAWLGLAASAPDLAKKHYCLKKALAIRPEDQKAQQALERLEARTGRRSRRGTLDQSAVRREIRQKPHQRGQTTGRSSWSNQTLGFTRTHVSVVISLTFVALAALAGLGFTITQSGASAWHTATPVTPQPAMSALIDTNTRFEFPPTWTPTQTLPPTTTPTVTGGRPTFALPNTPTYVPSITPIFELDFVIGYSVAGRPIEVYRFGRGTTRRLIVAGIHGGGELNTITLADELIRHIRHHPELIPPNVTLYILRSLNPDGEARAYSPDGRVNDNGVDLNRNWEVDWQANWPRDGCWALRPTHAGEYPGSEPETQALMEFLRSHKIDALINYHSATLGIFPSGDPPNQASVRLAEAIAAVSDYPYPPVKTGCRYTGTLVDWALSLGIAGVDLELTDHTHTDFETNLKVLEVLLTWQP